MAALPENDRITGPYIATAGQVDFPADFPLIDSRGLRVRRERDGVSEILSGDALSAVAPADDGFTARLVDPCEAGDRVWVFSDMPAERLRAHPQGGAVRTPTLEADAVEAQAQLQELRRGLSSALTAPVGEAALELPSAAERAGGTLMFDEDGQPVMGPPPGAPTDAQVENAIQPMLNDRALVGLENVSQEALSAKPTASIPLALTSATPTPRSFAQAKRDDIIVHAADWGVKADAATDDHAAWQTLYNMLANYGRGARIMTPQVGRSLLSATLLMHSDGITIEGPEAQLYHDVPGEELFTFAPFGSFAGTAIKHCTVANPAAAKTSGGGLWNINIARGFGRALHVQSVYGSRYRVCTSGVKGTEAILFDCVRDYRCGASPIEMAEPGDNQEFFLNAWGSITADGGCNVNADFVVFDGYAGTPSDTGYGGNTSSAEIQLVAARLDGTGHAIHCKNADNIDIVQIRKWGGGTGRPIYVRGGKDPSAATNWAVIINENINVHRYGSDRAAVYEGTEYPYVVRPATGKVGVDLPNGTPLPVVGVGCRVLTFDPLLVRGVRSMSRTPFGVDYYGMTLAETLAPGGTPIVSQDSGSGAQAMRMGSGGTLIYAELPDNPDTMRMLFGNGLNKVVANAAFNFNSIRTSLGGAIMNAGNGWFTLSQLNNGDMSFHVTNDIGGGNAELRFFYRNADGVVKSAALSMATL